MADKVKRIRICFCARPALDRLVPLIYKAMSSDPDMDVSAGFITSNTEETSRLKKVIDDSAEIYEVSGFIKENWESFSIDRLIEYEKKYAGDPIWKYIYTDRFLIDCDHEYCVKTTVGLFAFYEHVFTEGKFDCYYDEAVSTMQSYAAYLVGKSLGVNYISPIPARGGLEATHCYISDEPLQKIASFDDNYMSVQYDEEERERAERFLKDFIERDPRPFGLKYSEIKKKFSPHLGITWLESIVKFLKMYLNKSTHDPYFYMYYRQYRTAYKEPYFYFRYKLSCKYYKEPDYSKKFVYYPLHFQPESSTLVCAEKYEKQLFFIDSLAKSLPADTFLYVKEHYAELGSRALSFYKQLMQYPNVVIISPWISSREISLKSVALATLTGTAGFEAMLLGKPVIVGGDVFYENAPGVMKIEDIYGKYKPALDKWKQPEKEEIIQYLCEYFRNLINACCDYTHTNSYTDENTKILANAIYEYVISGRTVREEGGH